MLLLVGAEHLQMNWDGVSVTLGLVSASGAVHVSFSVQPWLTTGFLLLAVPLLFSIMSSAVSIPPLQIATQQHILYPICFHDGLSLTSGCPRELLKKKKSSFSVTVKIIINCVCISVYRSMPYDHPKHKK